MSTVITTLGLSGRTWLWGAQIVAPPLYGLWFYSAREALIKDLNKALKIYSYLLYFDHSDMKQGKK